MSRKSILQSAIDAAMAVLLPLLMARHLIGEEAHEWMGAAMTCLFLFHQGCNYRWYKHLFKGRYSPVRVLHTLVNMLLLADLLLMGISGVFLSAHVFSFLHLTKGASIARLIHLPGAYWGFLLMSFHIGLHWPTALGRVRAVLKTRVKRKSLTVLSQGIFICVCAYGIAAFFKRSFPDYLFLRTQFAFFDPSESLPLYLFDLISILVLFAALGYVSLKLLTKAGKLERKKDR